MTNVLIPTDFSEYSLNAIRYAVNYFSEVAANFFILHVSNGSLSGSDMVLPDGSQATFEDFVQHRLNLLEMSFSKEHRFFPIRQQSSLVEAIRHQVSSKNIDLIVMGTKGIFHSKKGPAVNHTYEVITKVKCPILVVPGNAKFDRKVNISFVTDYNCIYRNEVLQTLSSALELHDSPLRVLKPRTKDKPLTPVQTDNKGFIHYFFRDREHSFHFLQKENLEDGIQEFVDQYQISMIAIPARNLNFIQKLMLRFTSKSISYHTVVPFLVIHE